MGRLCYFLCMACLLLFSFPVHAEHDHSSRQEDATETRKRIEATRTGITAIDTLIESETSYSQGRHCFNGEEQQVGEEDDALCDGYSWFYEDFFDVRPVSSRLLSVLKFSSQADGGGPPYHFLTGRYIWDIREKRFIGLKDLLEKPNCLDSRPGDEFPKQQEMFDLIKSYSQDATLESVFEPIPEGFALWVLGAGITGPQAEEYSLSDLQFCGPRKEYWENPFKQE